MARRAGLDEDSFWLHKFRATFATTALRKGNDLTTVQHWIGHSDLASTMRYLRPNDSPEVQEKVESMWGSEGRAMSGSGLLGRIQAKEAQVPIRRWDEAQRVILACGGIDTLV